MTIGINISKYDASLAREVQFVIDNWVDSYLILVLKDFTKVDLKDFICMLKDEESGCSSHTSFIQEMEKILELNEGRRDGDIVEFTNTKGQKRLDEFIGVFE